MIGTAYWFTGIVLKPFFDEEGDTLKWGLSLQFYDGGFCEAGATEGELRVRYLVTDLGAGLDTLIADAKALGLQAGTASVSPTLYMHQDGSDPAVRYPSDWETLVQQQCERLQWRNIYAGAAGAT